MNLQLGTLKRGEYRELTEKELGDLMRMVEGSTNLPAREAAKAGKLTDPARRERKPANSGYQGKKNDRKPFEKGNDRKPFEKKNGTGKVWKNVRKDGEIKPEKKAPASPESWKPGARGPLGTAASRGCCGGVRTLRDREDVGSMGMLGDREASEVFIPLGGGCPGIAGWS